jgi:uncharacterized protein YkwD
MKLKLLAAFLLFNAVAYSQDNVNEVLNLLNEVRTDPSAFLNTRLIPYLKENPMEENDYVKSLMEELKSRHPIGALALSPVLSALSKGHAMDMGKKGTTGHTSSNGTSFADRVRKKVKGGMIGENCDYGNDTAIDIVMSLLIDDGIQSLGHRKNILNTQFHFIGIAIEPHKTYGTNCVMDFAEKL